MGARREDSCMSRRGIWSLRWRSAVMWLWCSFCLLTLASLTLRYILHYIHPDRDPLRVRWCPPEPVEGDGCLSWRPQLLPHSTCGCTRRMLTLQQMCGSDTWMRTGNSTCSHDATLRGPHQLVVSVSAPTLTPDLLATLGYAINQVNELYKGWVLRIYTHLDSHSLTVVCPLVCANSNLDVCNITTLPETVNTTHDAASFLLDGVPGWRWGVVGDPLVAAWALRHLHQAFLSRDAHALTQFINSDKCWHLMKDHPSHAHGPLGSRLLAGKTSWGPDELSSLRKHIILGVSSAEKEEHIFQEMVMPILGSDVMTHDSFTCHSSVGAVPFPSKRPSGQWVGMPTPMSPDHPSQNDHTKLTSMNLRQEQEASSVNAQSPTAITSRSHVVQSWSVHVLRTLGKSFWGTTTDQWKEEEVNRKKGIPPCPYSCRPPLHPDWDYC